MNEEPRPARWVKVSSLIPTDLYIVWDEVCEMLRKRGVDHHNELVRNGMVLEYLCAEYIASHRRQKK